MILDIPTSLDFQIHGEDYLNLAWFNAVELSTRHYATGEVEVLTETDPDDLELFARSQRELSSALILCHQGVEFLLKARIAETSPYLLLFNNPSQWPAKCDREEIGFSEFRTIDAQDLLKVANTVSQSRVSEAYAQKYHELRKIRNSTCHTVDKNSELTPRKILLSIFDALLEFYPNDRILGKRKEYISRDHNFIDEDPGEASYRVAYDADIIVKLLSPTEMKHYFDFDTSSRRYLCPYCKDCSHIVPFDDPLATFSPRSKGSTDLYCIVCDTTFEVQRKPCIHDGCKGDVIHGEGIEEFCLSCDTYQNQ